MTTIKKDVVVVAAGISGLAAAIAAAENGASVVAFEKANTTGGAANMGMGPLGVGSRLQKHQMINITPFEAFRKHMNYVHWQVDARLVRDYYMRSGDTIGWLEDMGVEFVAVMPAYSAPEVIKPYATSEATWHVVKPLGGGAPGPRAATAMIKAMTERAAELGVDIRLETPVTRLIAQDGAVVGAVATTAAGEEITAEAGAVIVATGGFGDNPRMIRDELGYEWGVDLHSFRIPGVEGEGLRMLWEAGAAKTQPVMELTYTTPGVTDVFKTISETMRQPILMVNLDGKRFMNEEYLCNTVYTGNAIRRQKGGTAFTIVDESVLSYFAEHGLDYVTVQHNVKDVANWDQEVAELFAGKDTVEQAGEGSIGALHASFDAKQYFFVADTVEDLAAQTGIDAAALKETIERYNACVAGGDQEEFKRAKFIHPMTGGKLYAAKHYPSAYGTLGGVAINDNTEVLDADGNKIPGLYSCGTDACSIFGDTYCFLLPGNTMGFAVNSGRIAGTEAIAYLDSDEFAE